MGRAGPGRRCWSTRWPPRSRRVSCGSRSMRSTALAPGRAKPCSARHSALLPVCVRFERVMAALGLVCDGLFCCTVVAVFLVTALTDVSCPFSFFFFLVEDRGRAGGGGARGGGAALSAATAWP
eukprot:3190034-Rhodomonas_salina.1